MNECCKNEIKKTLAKIKLRIKIGSRHSRRKIMTEDFVISMIDCEEPKDENMPSN